MREWLDEHKEINRSQLFREAVLRKQHARNRISPLLFLVSVMGIVFSIALIVIAMDPQTIPFLSPYIRLSMTLLGGVLAVITSLVYYKEWRQVSEKKMKEVNQNDASR